MSGNEQMYRTQINDRQGFLLRSLNYTSERPGAATSSTISTSTARTSAPVPRVSCACRPDRSTFSSSRSRWRETDLYSALPAFANPFLAEGIIPGQQTYNRHPQHLRRDARASSRKDHDSPLLGYTRNTYDGPGTTTYHFGGNEFQLNEQVNSVDELYRIGLGFQLGPFPGCASRRAGGTSAGARRTPWLPGAGDGNVTTPVLGQEITANAIASASRTRSTRR